MPYCETAELCLEIPNDDTRLWRFMDTAKFLAIISAKKLFFPSILTLRQGDPFEGTLPTKDSNRVVEKIKSTKELNSPSLHNDLNQVFGRKLSGREAADFIKDMMCMATGFFQQLMEQSFVNCWHANQVESPAMWSMYLKGNQGLAIQTTMGKLKAALKCCTDRDIYVGKVRYVDFDTFDMSKENYQLPAFFKRQSFEFEREVRACTIADSFGELKDSRKPLAGVDIDIDVEQLIEKVYISPASPKYIEEVIRSTNKAFGYDFPVHHSRLLEKPGSNYLFEEGFIEKDLKNYLDSEIVKEFIGKHLSDSNKSAT